MWLNNCPTFGVRAQAYGEPSANQTNCIFDFVSAVANKKRSCIYIENVPQALAELSDTDRMPDDMQAAITAVFLQLDKYQKMGQYIA